MDDRLGTLEAGKLVDVIVIDGEPDKNLDNLANVDVVIRDGYVVVEKGKVVIARHSPPQRYKQHCEIISGTGNTPQGEYLFYFLFLLELGVELSIPYLLFIRFNRLYGLYLM